MEKINERMKRELDEKTDFLEQLMETNKQEISKNQKLSDKAKASDAETTRLLVEIDKIKTDYSKQLDDKQTSLIQLQREKEALLIEKANDAAATRATKLKIISSLGLFALACVAGAVYSPIGKEKFAIMAAILGLIQPAYGICRHGMLCWRADTPSLP